MATQLDIKRIKLELMSISYAKAQTEFRIQEHQDAIEGFAVTLDAQNEKEQELIQKLKEIENEGK